MRQVYLVALLSVFTLFLGSCQIGNGDENAAVESVESSPATSQPSSTKAVPTDTKDPSFDGSLVPPRQENPVAVSGLLQTLPSRTVTNQAEKSGGRSDPFAAVPVQPTVTVSPDAQRGGRSTTSSTRISPQRTNPQPNKSSGGTGNNKASSPNRTSPPNPASGSKVGDASTPGSSNSKKANGANSPGSAGKMSPGEIAVAPFSPELPQLPEPDQAKAIEVTGVIQVDGVTNAIVKVPNEPARYVKPGQRLSNGQVLVKRIEMNGSPVPIVILEQYGVEVARRVGDKPAGESEKGSSTAAAPVQNYSRNTSPA